MLATHYETYLQPGEMAIEPGPLEHGSQEWAHDYRIVDIQAGEPVEGNSVLLDIQPAGNVEPVMITHPITLSVRALRGHGYAVVIDPALDAETQLTLLDPQADPLELEVGDAYYFLNASGKEKLVLRDDCTPAFQGHEEVPLVGPQPEGAKIDGRDVRLPLEFLIAFGALQSVPHDELRLRDTIIGNATYQGNHGISYKAIEPLKSADHYEVTGQTLPGIRYVQLNDGLYPKGTKWWRSEEDFLRGTEKIDGIDIPIMTLRSMPLTLRNLRIVAPFF